MAKTIITQDSDLVNYANVVAITVDAMSEKDVDYSPDEAFVLVAYDITNAKIALGYYPTDEKAREAEMSLVNWLDSEAFGVYKLNSEGAV